MKNTAPIATVCILLLTSASGGAVDAARTFSAPQYSVELERLSSLADSIRDHPDAAERAISELRGNWKVNSEGHDFLVDTGWLIDRFEKGPSDERARSELKSRLDQLAKEAQAFERPVENTTGSRAKLDQILARREFHQVHGPTPVDRLKYRILDWIFRLLSRLFGASSAPTAGRDLVWTLVAGAVFTLAYFVYRTLRQNARREIVIPQVKPISARGWRSWMAEAQAAASHNQWREAVHLAYWAGISFLEERRAWRPDKARTPREYLRLLPAESAHRPALSALTRQLEVTWYGNDPAGPDTFSETVTLLEDLGCRQA